MPSRNSLMPSPRVRASSGIRLAPKSNKRIASTTIRWEGEASPVNIGVSPLSRGLREGWSCSKRAPIRSATFSCAAACFLGPGSYLLVCLKPVVLTSSRIRFFGKLAQDVKEFLWLPDKQPVLSQSLESALGRPLGLGWADDRNSREFALEEDRGLGHHQAGLEELFGSLGVEVWERQAVRGVGQRRRVARHVVPDLEVGSLGRTDAEQDAQHLLISDPLRQCRVEAGAPLLDETEMEGRRVRYGLDVFVGGEVVVVAGDGRKPSLS